MTKFACAKINGNSSNPNLTGTVAFYENQEEGVWVEALINGLPDSDSPIHSKFFAFHIHENGDCTLPFDKTGTHYNPLNQAHPNHAGDFPSLLSNKGFAYLHFYTNRFNTEDIVGKSVIIHSSPDDFTTQPSGNSGDKIACGVIKATDKLSDCI